MKEQQDMWWSGEIAGKVSLNVTIVLVKPKVTLCSYSYFDKVSTVISLCHQYRAWPVCVCMQSDQALYCWLVKLKMTSLFPENCK